MSRNGKMERMSDARFHYRGPASIGGVQLPHVDVHENPPEDGRRSWEGEAFLSPAPGIPAGFLDALVSKNEPWPLELPDGRRAEVFVEHGGFGEDGWTFNLTGIGAAPA